MSDTDEGVTPDQGDTAGDQAAVAGDGDSGTRTRERSTIGFPYDDLSTVLRLVEIAHDSYGGSCTADQLAAPLKMKAKSGSFRLKVSAGRTFGVLGGTGSQVTTTPLGVRALSKMDRASRADAFLTVPLYRALYDSYQGADLPGDTGLEVKIRELGVSEKQVTTARQVFLRSADQAGFFIHGRSRLVMPAAGMVVGDRGETPRDEAEEEGVDVPPIMKHPLVQGLLAALPDPGDPFPDDDRDLWLQTFDMNLSVIYGRPQRSRQDAAGSHGDG